MGSRRWSSFAIFCLKPSLNQISGLLLRNICSFTCRISIFHMATNTNRNVAKTLREAPNTNSYGHINVLSYWNGLCIYPVNQVWIQRPYNIYDWYKSSIIQDIKQKLYSHNFCVSPESTLFTMFNMKSISIAFPQWYLHYQCILPSSRWGDNYRHSHQLSHANAFTWALGLYYRSKHYQVAFGRPFRNFYL